MKFYRYVIYKLYSWAKKRSTNTPIGNVILTLSFVHFVQLFTIYMVVLKFIPEISIFHKVNKNWLYIFLPVFFTAHYFIFYNKKRWQEYEKEFSGETEREKRKGGICVISYLVGSIVLNFLLMFLYNRI